MRKALIALAVLVALAIAFVVFRVGLVLMDSGPSQTVLTTTSRVEDHALICTLTLSSDRPMSVVSLDAPRTDASAIGLAPPSGFAEKAMPSGDDPASAAEWNAKNVRFVGRLALNPGVATELRFPLTGDPSAPIEIEGTMEGKWGMGGTMSFFRISYQGTATAKP